MGARGGGGKGSGSDAGRGGGGDPVVRGGDGKSVR